MTNKEYEKYIDWLIEKAMVKIMANPDNIDIDPESYEDMKSLANEMDFDL